jgi:hypothetical protein
MSSPPGDARPEHQSTRFIHDELRTAAGPPRHPLITSDLDGPLPSAIHVLSRTLSARLTPAEAAGRRR